MYALVALLAVGVPPPQAPRPPQAPPCVEASVPAPVKGCCSPACCCGCNEGGGCDCAVRTLPAVAAQAAPAYAPQVVPQAFPQYQPQFQPAFAPQFQPQFQGGFRGMSSAAACGPGG
jgi:hypothetical protein